MSKKMGGTVSPTEITALREKLGMSQSLFAMVIGVSKKTVKSWEMGTDKPDDAAIRLITIMQNDPEFSEKYEQAKKGLK
ncbi:MAG: helix-turn-helix domain-containing protein [Oscillospiraceae bacterium]|nr:helix-turn-helix domain-containing protein [Oscillospiraceae bacterium]